MLPESRNNHGDAVTCWWEEGSERSSTVGEHFYFTICFSKQENKHSLSRLQQSLT